MKDGIVKFNVPELQAIGQSKAQQIRATFEPMAVMLLKFEELYNSVVLEAEKEITEEVIMKARKLRLDIVKIRSLTEKTRKEQKEEYLRAGKAIDGVSNILKWAVSDKENKLKEIEKHFEIREQKRLEVLQRERSDKLSKYIENAHERNLSEMAEDVWCAYLESKKREYEDRITTEKKIEKERMIKEKAEAEERKRIEKENKRLKKEAAKREELAKIEKEKREEEEAKRKLKEKVERERQEEKECKERKIFETKLRIEREKKEKIKQVERAKYEKLKAKLKAKEDAERKIKEEKTIRIQVELNKDDIAKVNDLIVVLKTIKTKYSFKTIKNKKMYEDIGVLIDKIIRRIKN